MKTNFFNKYKQIIINILVVILLIFVSTFLIYIINIKSDFLVILQWIIEGLIIFVDIILILNLLSKYEIKQFKIKVVRIIMITFSVCMIIFSIILYTKPNSDFKNKEIELYTIEDKTKIKKENTMSYIKLNDSNFTKIEDYNKHENRLKIGFVDNIDNDNIQYALDAIATNIHKEYYKYNNFKLLINALYNKEIDLILINEEYRKNLILIKDSFEKDTSIVYQTQLLKNKVKEIEENKEVNLIESVLLVGSYNDGEIEIDDEANIIELLTISPKTKQIIITDISSYLKGFVGEYKEDELLKYASKFGTSTIDRNMEDSFGYIVQDHIKFNMTTISDLMDILETIEVELPDDLKTSVGKYNFNKGKNILDKDKVIAILKEDDYDNDLILSKFRQEIFKSIIQKISSQEFATNNFYEILTLLHTLERGISDDYIFNRMNYQLLTDTSWDIKTYNFEYEKDSVRSSLKRRRFRCYNIEFESIEDFNKTIRKVFDGEKI